jgi:hypothetical protein
MRNILIIIEDGRLGNQIFQYFASRNLFQNYIIIFFGFSSLLMLFPQLDGNFIFSKKNKVNNLAIRFFILIKKFLTELKIFTVVEEVYTSKDSYLKINSGFFKKIIICKNTYFQSLKFLDLSYVDKYFGLYFNQSNKNFYHKKKKNIFLHIRRGDYKFWPSSEYPAVCPLDWYVEALKKICALYSNASIQIFTDDLEYAELVLPLLQRVVKNRFEIIHDDECHDFLSMAECVGGILSPSSFAWWASYFSLRMQERDNSVFIAPNYWAGHAQKKWYPCEEISAPWITYLSVKS